ncbi:hypothetical protein [Allobaculum sp. JKK-2023]|nr:hypothetical protein [Allobaculum sp. JKK-2023]
MSGADELSIFIDKSGDIGASAANSIPIIHFVFDFYTKFEVIFF